MKKTQRSWREKGVIRKLYNIVIFVRASPQRREAFKRKTVSNIQTDYLMLILDNLTR
jgi:hAT family C-terminal dimerisation region